MGLVSCPSPIQWNNFQADLIREDGTFVYNYNIHSRKTNSPCGVKEDCAAKYVLGEHVPRAYSKFAPPPPSH